MPVFARACDTKIVHLAECAMYGGHQAITHLIMNDAAFDIAPIPINISLQLAGIVYVVRRGGSGQDSLERQCDQ